MHLKHVIETLREYYTRTLNFWTEKAYEETDQIGKALRRDAFELAQETFTAMQPELERIRETLQADDILLMTRNKPEPSQEPIALRSRNR